MADIPPPPPPGPPPAAPPPPAPYAPPPAGYPQQQGMLPPQPPSPGYMPPPITPAAGGINVGAQLVGASYSIGVGVVGILLPIFSGMLFGGTVYYFYVLPVFGLIYGVRSITRGFVIGGIVGIVLNVLAGIASLAAAGLFNSGG